MGKGVNNVWMDNSSFGQGTRNGLLAHNQNLLENMDTSGMQGNAGNNIFNDTYNSMMGLDTPDGKGGLFGSGGMLQEGMSFLTTPMGQTNYANDYLATFPKGVPGMTSENLKDFSTLQDMDNASGGASPMEMGMGLMNAYNMYNSWQNQDKYMGMMNKQLAMATEQWDMTKQEVARIAQVRKNLNSSYA